MKAIIYISEAGRIVYDLFNNAETEAIAETLEGARSNGYRTEFVSEHGDLWVLRKTI